MDLYSFLVGKSLASVLSTHLLCCESTWDENEERKNYQLLIMSLLTRGLWGKHFIGKQNGIVILRLPINTLLGVGLDILIQICNIMHKPLEIIVDQSLNYIININIWLHTDDHSLLQISTFCTA